MKYTDKKEFMKALNASPTFNIISQANMQLRSDKEVVLLAVTTNEKALKYASKTLQKDKEVIKEALKKGYGAFEFASQELKEDKDFILELIEINPWVLYWTQDTPINDDKEVIIKALKCGKENTNVLMNASQSLKADKELMLVAVKKYGINILHTTEELKNDKDVALAAVRKDPTVKQFLGKELIKEISDNGIDDNDIMEYLYYQTMKEKVNLIVPENITAITKKIKI